MRADYEAWNPYETDGESAADIAARHGVSKNTMYTWRSRGWKLNGREGDGVVGWKPRPGGRDQPASHEDLESVIQYLTEQLVLARIRIDQLERGEVGDG